MHSNCAMYTDPICPHCCQRLPCRLPASWLVALGYMPSALHMCCIDMQVAQSAPSRLYSSDMRHHMLQQTPPSLGLQLYLRSS